ncbi:SDR family NAD(P)-dependent oxidoreductase [Amorphus orientalis]|uniref:NAD(P)-dependent dehydrogenase (Short-subunit alcohol dehydrogenase family) n=1 Tax=Amorphus orientalis TaxID=649198 RepID=A0AAE3VPB5_9HYPH|nr:SDR family oxidoreductase [Amorphus orientalis]MDQ0315782.1 NAD(P)-dependent dehydrogenase (short-subunit alcohol dehydrogenase family) [Amorphus orientalis]
MATGSEAAPVAAITGGAGGIGEATVARLVRDGWQVVVLDRDVDQAKAVAERQGVIAHEIDLADTRSIRDAAQWVEREVGPCRGLAAVAAHLENPHMPEDQDADEWDAIVRVNLTGTFRTLTEFGQGMLARRAGSIVTIGSITAFNSSPLQAYGPTKAAILNMSRNFAVAWGRRGIRVNCVCPGPTRTPAVEASYARGERSPDTMIRETALGRLVMPEQVANAIGFLLSDDAGAITGIELPVDAGVLATQVWGLYGGVPQPADD